MSKGNNWPQFSPPGTDHAVSKLSDISPQALGDLAAFFAQQAMLQDAQGKLGAQKLVGFPSDATKVLKGDGTWGSSGITVYDRATTTVDVASTAAETSIYTKSIAANTLGTNFMVRLTAKGDFLHNNSAGDTVSIAVKFGGTTFIKDATDLLGVTSTARMPWKLIVEVSNLGATNSQYIDAHLVYHRDTTAPTNGIGSFTAYSLTNTGIASLVGISTLGTIDTTAARTLDVTATWSASSANNSFRMRYAVLELV